MSLSKTVALVTGGSSGLGAAAVRYLRQQGAKVLIADLQEPSPALLDEPPGSPAAGSVLWSPVDVTQAESVTQALDMLQETFGQPLNACIQCAGVATARKMISGKGQVHPMEDFTKTLHVNTFGTFNVARLAAERMRENIPDEDGLRGCLVHTASIAAFEGQIGQVAYSASKAAIVGMTLPMARDLAPLGIRVMTVVGRSHAWLVEPDGLLCLLGSVFRLA
jgi:3-hydroxyacyl-CoA dehydrogenase/3-hydroxy-2-methylbutyryl-CoA dehydrogenase